MKKLIYSFDDKSAKKLKNIKNILGGKGANLGEMGRIGLPVPPGFTISTEVCKIFYKNKQNLPNSIIKSIEKQLILIEKKNKKKIWRFKKSIIGFCKIRSTGLYAWYDGHYSKSWSK